MKRTEPRSRRPAKVLTCIFLLLGTTATFTASAQETGSSPSKKKIRPFVPPPWPPPLRPSEAQMRDAYDLATKRILVMAKYPPSTKIFPIEKSWFEAVGTINNIESVTAYIVVDGQNSFGGMVRSTAICSIRLGQKVANCDWTSGDMVAREMIPADAVHGPQPKPASK